jgi:hypothetical protein
MNSTRQGKARYPEVVLIAWLFFGSFSGPSASAQTEACPRGLAMKAESEASTLVTWRAVFESYKKYKQCDDGAIAEGYSSSIATMLADHWEDIDQLTRLSNQNTGFRKFVLRHLDETMNFDQATIIKRNVEQRCPSGAKKLCDEIRRQFSDAWFRLGN